MKKGFTLLAVFLVVALAMPITLVQAQSATQQTWMSSITYYTPSNTPGELTISFYSEGSATPITLPPITLNPHAAGSLYVGGVTALGSTFHGTAVLEATVYVIATAVQFAVAPETNNYGRLLYSGFTPTEAASTFYIPTVLNAQYGSTSLIAIQNIENFEITANVKFYAVGSTTPTVDKNYDIPAQSNVILPCNNFAKVGLPTGFSGSAVITAYQKGNPSVPGRVVASVQETDDNGRGAYAFEGVASGANTIYMATMLCNAFGGQNSYYAIQNASLAATANVTIDFYDTGGSLVGQLPSTALGPGNKMSVNPCDRVPAGTSGSAVIRSTGAPVIAIGKVKAPNGMATAFVGQSAGSTKIAAPYIRWAATPTSEWRTYVAVMNVGTSAATNIVAKYYDGNGTLKASHVLATPGSPLAQYIKTNTTAQAAVALLPDGTFGFTPPGGSIEIESDQPLVVVVRAQKDVTGLGATTRFAEDYNGVSIP
jgi:hypothetical protein